jgi:F-box protein 8
MGQIFDRQVAGPTSQNQNQVTKISDISQLPPELALEILKNLNATDLCLAACVWQTLANDEILWLGLCKSNWAYASIYNRARDEGISFRKIYLQLDEGTLRFNAGQGLQYFIDNKLLDDTCEEISKFIHNTRKLRANERRKLLQSRRDILERLIELQSYENQFLPNALRQFFAKLDAPEDRNEYLSVLIENFSKRFHECNKDLGLSIETIYVLCFSLILLSIDLTSPHVKNKMSKREFIRNTRRAIINGTLSDELAGHLYDNIYLIGHVARSTTIAR